LTKVAPEVAAFCESPLIVRGLLLEAVGDAAATQVIGGKLHRHPVAFEDSDVVLAHPARNVSQNLVTVLQLDPEVRVGKHLGNGPLHLDCILRQADSPYLVCTADQTSQYTGS